MRKIAVFILPFVLFVACKQQAVENSQDKLVQSVLWYQHSGEMRALYYQGYNLATSFLSSYKPSEGELPPAVVLDIDETILDNSPQSGQQIIDNQPYSEEIWDRWCNLAEAEPLPGALEFTLKARELGIEVFYITNRMTHTAEVTRVNLEKAGFPNADSIHILTRDEGTSSSKNERRQKVAENFSIILFLGDNLGDFDGMFDDRSLNEGRDAVDLAKDKFGSKFIVFPNPIYGNWERAALAKPDGTRAEAKDAVRGYQKE